MKLKSLTQDVSASIIVVLIALPLCLGIALASNTPPISGIIAGIVGGIIVGLISDSALGVSGPAAGLVAICVTAINNLGSYETFLVSIILAGIFQIIIGLLKGGNLSYYFPSSVITGMLTSIGIIIVLKQLPHAFGYDKDFEGDLAFHQPDQQNTISEIFYFWKYLHPPSALIFFIGILVTLLWQKIITKYFPNLAMVIQAPLAIVIFSILLVKFFLHINPNIIQTEHLVNIPSIKDFTIIYKFPDWKAISNHQVWYYAFIIAFVASIETLLCVEATDNLDPKKRITNRNRELIAQGIGNIFSGFLGGLPITQVTVRSSANINFGAQTKISAILHGVWLLLSVIFLREFIILIPLSALATILIVVGFNLARPSTFKSMYKKGWKEFIPFLISILTILFTDLLIGTLIGLISSIVIQFYIASVNAIKITKKHNYWLIEIDDSASFMNKSKLIKTLNTAKENDIVEVIYKGKDEDIIMLLSHQEQALKSKNIECKFNFLSTKKNFSYENAQH